jgi:hypothetical protein
MKNSKDFLKNFIKIFFTLDSFLYICKKFLLRKSCPEFYPLQEKQRKGEPIVAICIGHPRLIYDPFDFKPHTFIKCRIGEEEFISSMNENGDWEINDKI